MDIPTPPAPTLIPHTHNGIDSPLINKQANNLSSGGGGGGGAVCFFNGQSLGGSVTVYFGPNIESTNEIDAQVQVPRAGTIKNFYFRTYTSQGGGGAYTLTIRVNGVSSGVSATVGAGSSAAFFSDTTHHVDVAAGDKICIQGINASSSSAASISSFSFELT